MMAIAFRAIGTKGAGGNTAASVTPGVPAGTAVGDILIVCCLSGATQEWESVTDDASNTYALIADNSENGDLTTAWYWTRVGSVPTAITADRGGGGGQPLAVVYAFSGCVDTGTPYEDATLYSAAGSPTSSSTPTGAVVTATGDGRLPVVFASVDDDPDYSSGNPPSGWDDLGGVSDTSGSDARIDAIARQTVLDDGASTTAPTVGTLPASDFWQTLSLLLIPAATGQTVSAGQTAETDTAQTVAKAKAKSAGQPVEADLAQPAGRAKTKATGQPIEAETAQPVTAAKAAPAEQASEADTAAAVGRAKAGPVAATVSAETAQPVAKAKTLPVAQAAETDSAQPVAWAPKHRLLSTVSEADTSQPVAAAKTLTLARAAENETAQPVSRAGRTVTIAQAAETDAAQAAAAAKAKPASQATETATGRSVTAAKAAEVGQASSTDAAQPLTHTKTRLLGQATEADTARPVAQAGQTITVGQPVETDAAQPVGAASAYQVSAAQGTEVALPITPVGGRPLTRGGGLWSVDDLLDDINRERLDEEDAVALVLALID